MAAASSSSKGFADPRYRALIQRLIDARKAGGWSQEAFAKRLGRHQQFVSRYETGERRLDAVEFIDLARALGLDPAAMVGDVATVEGAPK